MDNKGLHPRDQRTLQILGFYWKVCTKIRDGLTGLVGTTLFWDFQGMTFVGYLKNCKTISSADYQTANRVGRETSVVVHLENALDFSSAVVIPRLMEFGEKRVLLKQRCYSGYSDGYFENFFSRYYLIIYWNDRNLRAICQIYYLQVHKKNVF